MKTEELIKETCSKCLGCCNSLRIPFHKESEAGRKLLQMWENEELPEGHKVYDDSRKDFWIYNSNSEQCVFLEEKDYSCTIQDIKPVICKLFPLKWVNQHHYYIDICSLSFVIPLKEIYSWKDAHKNIITSMYQYVDPSKHSQRNRFNNLEYLIPISRIIFERELIKEVLFNED